MKKAFLISLTLCLVGLCAACGSPAAADAPSTPSATPDVSPTVSPTRSAQFEKPPELQLIYTIDGTNYSATTTQGGFSWTFALGNGNTVTTETDAPHPLEFGRICTINQAENLKELELRFALAPDSFTVKRWDDSYIGNAQKYSNHFGPVEFSGNTISFSNDGVGYVYEVSANWPQGRAYYGFYLK